MAKDSTATMLDSMTDTSDEDWLGKKYKRCQFDKAKNSNISSSEEESEEDIGPNLVEFENSDYVVQRSEVNTALNLTENEDTDTDENMGMGIDEDLYNEDLDDDFVMSSIEEDKHLCEFTKFLCSIDSGEKSERCAKKHARTLQLILRFTDAPNNDFTLLLDRSFLNK